MELEIPKDKSKMSTSKNLLLKKILLLFMLPVETEKFKQSFHFSAVILETWCNSLMYVEYVVMFEIETW